jgi:hypothetical protein
MMWIECHANMMTEMQELYRNLQRREVVVSYYLLQSDCEVNIESFGLIKGVIQMFSLLVKTACEVVRLLSIPDTIG